MLNAVSLLRWFSSEHFHFSKAFDPLCLKWLSGPCSTTEKQQTSWLQICHKKITFSWNKNANVMCFFYAFWLLELLLLLFLLYAESSPNFKRYVNEVYSKRKDFLQFLFQMFQEASWKTQNNILQYLHTFSKLSNQIPFYLENNIECSLIQSLS